MGYRAIITLKYLGAMFILLAGFLLPQNVIANGRIGLVKTFTPGATVTRQGSELELKLDSKILEGDTITTDSEGTIGITFSDGSVLTLGPDGKITVDNFLFDLAENKFSFISEILKGTVVFMSGAIGKFSPGSIRFKTPTTTLGLRGTKLVIEVD